MEAMIKTTTGAAVKPSNSFSIQITNASDFFFFPVVVPHCKAQFYPIYSPQLLLTIDLELKFYKSPKLNEFSPFFPESEPQALQLISC